MDIVVGEDDNLKFDLVWKDQFKTAVFLEVSTPRHDIVHIVMSKDEVKKLGKLLTEFK